MNVKEMLSIMQALGIGEVYSDKKSKEIDLLFLNLANDELYSETASLNDKVSIRVTKSNVINQSYITLDEEPFLISTVCKVGSRFRLKGLSSDEFDQFIAIEPNSSTPQAYNNLGKIIHISPITNGVVYPFNVRYTPERTALQENTTEQSIPYPAEYHNVLVNGALYYKFQDESGFKNTLKENEAIKKWEEGKMKLVSYFKGRYNKNIYTFENA